jgi:hypothetical protein
MFEYLKFATQLKYSEFIQNREERQLIEEALRARENAEPFYYEALAGLGRHLTDWGERLQDRYERAAEMPLDLPPFESVPK